MASQAQEPAECVVKATSAELVGREVHSTELCCSVCVVVMQLCEAFDELGW